MTERKTEKVKMSKVGIMFILSIVAILYFTMLAVGDENGQEYEFYNAAKENAIEYVNLGIITPEPIANMANSEKRSGNKTEYLFNIPESIYKIKIRNTTVTSEEIVIETLKHVSNLTTAIPAGDVYVNENIWITPDTEIYVDFKIKNSWLNNNDNVQLLKWTGDKWKKLGLRKIGKDDVYTYFEEGVAGSSVLSIVGTKKRLANGEISSNNDGSSNDGNSGNDNKNGQKSPLTSLPIGTGVVILLGVILALYIVLEELKTKKDKN